MRILRIQGATRTLGAPHEASDDVKAVVDGLPIRDVMHETIGPMMVSAWEPSVAELQALINGASIRLWVAGTGHPIVALSVE